MATSSDGIGLIGMIVILMLTGNCDESGQDRKIEKLERDVQVLRETLGKTAAVTAGSAKASTARIEQVDPGVGAVVLTENDESSVPADLTYGDSAVY